MMIVEQMQDIVFGAGEEIVDAEYVVSLGQQPLAEMRAEEANPARDQDTFAQHHGPYIL
jgi:hypothetical protein